MAVARWAPHAVMLLVILAWSGAFTMIKIALEELTALDVTLLRFLVPVPLFVALLAVTGWPRFSRDERRAFALVAVLSVGGYHLALNYGETAVSAGVAALIVATGPVWTAVVSALVLKERLGARKTAGIAIALAGVVALVVGQGLDLGVRYVAGAFVVALAPLTWAVSSVASKPLLARHSPLAFTAAATLAGTALMLPLALASTPARAFAEDGVAGALRALDLSAWTWIALLHLGLAATFGGYVGFNYALRALTPTETMAYVYLNPLFALAWARVLGGETLTTFIVLAGLVVVVGVAITNWPGARSRAGARPEVTASGTTRDETR